VVREVNEHDIFHPKVEVISPEAKKGFVDIEKEKIDIVAALNPFGEGKIFLDSVRN